MRAKPGDWLIGEIAGTDHDARIEEVGSSGGAPPFLVRWLDTGRTGLVFPGLDAHAMRQNDVEARGARAAARAAVGQRRIAHHGGKP